MQALASLQGLIVIDEMQRRPDLFEPLQDFDLRCGARRQCVAALTDPDSMRTCLTGVGLQAVPAP
jgi:hypothetical protein